MVQFTTYEEENIHYWTNRAPGYSAVNQEELAGDQKTVWRGVISGRIAAHLPGKRPEEIRVLDVGTGPGFFAILLAELGYQVTAVDYTASMLDEARRNAGALASRICFRQMNAEELSFEAASFDVLVTRNVTWNLHEPEKAYAQWTRRIEARRRTSRTSTPTGTAICGTRLRRRLTRRTEQIFLIPMCAMKRPEPTFPPWKPSRGKRRSPAASAQRGIWTSCTDLGCRRPRIRRLWKQVWTKEERINNASTPMFLVEARKCPLLQ